MAKQIRVHTLAKELGVTSKGVLEKCRAEGLEVKNHMASLSAGLEETIREWFSEGTHDSVAETAARVDLTKARKKAAKKTKKKTTTRAETDDAAAAPAATAVAEAAPADMPAEPPLVEMPSPTEVAAAAVEPPAPGEAEPPAEPATEEALRPAAEAPVEVLAEDAAAPADDVDAIPPVAAEAETAAGDVQAEPEPEPPQEAEEEPAVEEPILPAGPQLTQPEPAQLKGPQVIRVEAPEPPRRYPPRTSPRPSGPRPPRSAPPAHGAGMPPTRGERGPGGGRRGKGRETPGTTEEGRRGKGAKHRVHPRRSNEKQEADERIREFRDRDLLEREERLKAAGERGGLRRRVAESHAQGQIPRVRTSQVEMDEPIVLKNLCAAMGISFSRVFPKLAATGKMVRITDTIDEETAQLIATEFEIELTVKPARSMLEDLHDEFDAMEKPNPTPRPPVVTFLGHVDHGKTSLLDAVRKSRLLNREAGGITQQIGAYRFCEGGHDVTFIDTPGHEAFTAMRSRGATMTDVVVLVVAADDGVMQTTREAIQHARAAEVPIVVALNKIDLAGIDLNRVYGQLAEENLAPAEWGGETDVIKTSAVTGEGIDDLLEHLTTLTDLLELQGDPTAAATGWVVETEEKRGEGIVATLLVKDGTLKQGDMIVCGPAHGRIRAMRNDQGSPVAEAPPGTPVEVSGLDGTPVAGDRFYQSKDLKRAKQIAQEQQTRIREASLAELSKPQTLEEIFKEREAEGVPELNVILRSDTLGKLETLRAELSNIPDEQVRLRILLDGIGAVTESDVMLASTSGAIIIGYWVTSEDSARRLAQETGVDIRLYRVIYEVTDDIRLALEGLLEPERTQEYRGRLEVRQIFPVSRVGTVAGCYVADGLIARNHRLRLVRNGALIREDCEIGSLRRIKDDVREVRAGLECGVKIEGFDDVHAGDEIESYEIIETARTLS